MTKEEFEGLKVGDKFTWDISNKVCTVTTATSGSKYRVMAESDGFSVPFFASERRHMHLIPTEEK